MLFADEAELHVIGFMSVDFLQHHLQDLLVPVLQDGSEDLSVDEVENRALKKDHDFPLV